ncbi:hypothetical protein HK104_008802 [Borealophlyctis nickersoniae]|nr:hypothetical protein HK104_008802 [Borealophlyctis nickersoniae]
MPPRLKSVLITAAVKSYVTNCQVYTNRVPLPVSGKARKKVKGKVLSTVLGCLQGIANWDPITMRGFLQQFMDPCYTTFLLDAVTYVEDDIRANVLQGRALYITEKDAQTRRSHPTLVEAKLQFEKWIPVHFAILQRFEYYARSETTRKDCLIFKPFSILPKYGLTPKFIIVNTDQTLFDLWNLAGWPGVQPPDMAAFTEDSDTWWRRTFCIERVETVNRRFRGAVYLDGVSCRVSVKKRILGPAEPDGIEEDEGGEDGGGGGEFAADALEDSDEETGPADEDK